MTAAYHGPANVSDQLHVLQVPDAGRFKGTLMALLAPRLVRPHVPRAPWRPRTLTAEDHDAVSDDKHQLTLDETLVKLLAMVGDPVDVHVMSTHSDPPTAIVNSFGTLISRGNVRHPSGGALDVIVGSAIIMLRGR